jgi:DNA repair ATPase RecN
MIKYLQITNIVLVETAQINFKPGLNVLSGETGSGKSAIIHALSLITGDRADTGMIRHGEEKGIVEAIFDLTALITSKGKISSSDAKFFPQAKVGLSSITKRLTLAFCEF